MLEFNLKRIVALKGLKEARTACEDAGISAQVFRRMLEKKTFKATAEQLERLCLALKCTPNDIYQWTPSANAPENHPLEALKHAVPNLQTKIANMTVAEIAAMEMKLL